MTSGIRSKILLSFGVLVVVLGCSSTAFSQTTCTTTTVVPGTILGGPGQRVELIGKTDTGYEVYNICRDTANPSRAQRSTKSAACPNPPAQQSTITAAEAAENARREKEEERAKRKQAEEERQKSINELKVATGRGSRGLY